VTNHSSNQAATAAVALAAFDRSGTVLAEYLTPDELARELGLCKRTLDRWHAGRYGPPRVTVGRRPLYRRSAVQEWLRSREQNFEEPKSARSRRSGRR
jgi:excisionase family DNA binding protein